VSTDKAKKIPPTSWALPKRIMEDVIFGESHVMGHGRINGADSLMWRFSDGSLLQTVSGRDFWHDSRSPHPVTCAVIFVTGAESGALCLLSLVLGDRRDIFFPNLDAGLDLPHLFRISPYVSLRQPVTNQWKWKPKRMRVTNQIASSERGKWPCFFFNSNTPGEKNRLRNSIPGDDNVSFRKFS